MRRLFLALLIAATLLAGCGEDDPVGDAGTDPAPSESSMSIGDPQQEPTVVAVVSGLDAGGRVSAEPVEVGQPEQLADFARQLGDARMVRELRSAAEGAEIPEGQSLLAAVVAIGCDPPTVAEVRVDVRDGSPTVAAASQKSDRQCYVPTISVALVTAVV